MKPFYIIIIACACLLPGTLWSATITAVGNGNWTTNSVWSCNCQPSSSDNVVIPAGITITTTSSVFLFLGPVIDITIGGTLVLNNSSLVIDSTDVVTILNGGKITGAGILGGSIFSGATPVTIGNGSSINGPKVITNGILPVKLVYFKNEVINNGIQLEWTSAAEENFDYYDIQRSANGTSFTSIATIPGKDVNGATYTFIDTSPLEATNYYRLAAVDLDGLREEMQVIKADWNGRRDWITIYPNPVSDGTIHALFFGGETGSLSLLDSNGLVVAEGLLTKASSCLQLPATVTPGIYFLIAQMDGRTSQIKVIVK